MQYNPNVSIKYKCDSMYFTTILSKKKQMHCNNTIKDFIHVFTFLKIN